MTGIGRAGDEAASSSEGGNNAPPARRLRRIPAIRGAIAVTLGVLATVTGSHLWGASLRRLIRS